MFLIVYMFKRTKAISIKTLEYYYLLISTVLLIIRQHKVHSVKHSSVLLQPTNVVLKFDVKNNR